MELQDSVITPTDFAPVSDLAADCGRVTGLLQDPRVARDLARPESANTRAVIDVEIPTPRSKSTYSNASDDQLLTAAKSSDGRAFEELSYRHLGSIRKRVYSIVRNPEDTDDVVQDSLLSAYSHLQKFRESCSFSTWITRIAINAALMLLRKRKSHPEVSLDQSAEADQSWSTWEVPDTSPNAERAYAMEEALEIMSRAVKRLPPEYRSVLEQCHAQERSLRETADRLGITIASAKSRLFRARRTLRSRLEGRQISSSAY
jgi:RNA polymerase sigma-70 factor (ECF subfamily)